MFTSQEIIGDIVYISFSDPERYVDIGIKAESSHFKVLGYDNLGIWVEHPSLLVFKDSKSKNIEIQLSILRLWLVKGNRGAKLFRRHKIRMPRTSLGLEILEVEHQLNGR